MRKEVRDYIEVIPEKHIEPFEYVRDRLLKIENIEETFDYSMPTFGIGKRKLFALASQKNYVSLYVMHIEVLDMVREQLNHLNVGKSCVRFKKVEKLPIEIIDFLIEESLKLL